jgi:hypothetical protein
MVMIPGYLRFSFRGDAARSVRRFGRGDRECVPVEFTLSEGFHEPVEQAVIQAGNPSGPQGAAYTRD